MYSPRAVGVAAVIQSVDAKKDVGDVQDLGPGQGIAEEDGIAGRDIGEGNFGGHRGGIACPWGPGSWK